MATCASKKNSSASSSSMSFIEKSFARAHTMAEKHKQPQKQKQKPDTIYDDDTGPSTQHKRQAPQANATTSPDQEPPPKQIKFAHADAEAETAETYDASISMLQVVHQHTPQQEQLPPTSSATTSAMHTNKQTNTIHTIPDTLTQPATLPKTSIEQDLEQLMDAMSQSPQSVLNEMKQSTTSPSPTKTQNVLTPTKHQSKNTGSSDAADARRSGGDNEVTEAAASFAAATLLDPSDMSIPTTSVPTMNSAQRQVIDSLKNHRKTTKSLPEALDFVPDLLGKALDLNSDSGYLHDDDDDQLLKSLSTLADEFSNGTTSTAFAGICAHDVSDRMLAATLSRALGRHVKPPKALWHIEIDTFCQNEIMLLHSHQHNPSIYSSVEDQPCLFTDINDFWRDDIRPIIDLVKARPWMALETLAPLLVERRAVRLSANCKVHKRVCRLRPVDRHSAGSMCTAFSSQGLQQALADDNIVCLLAWLLEESNKNMFNIEIETEFVLALTLFVYLVLHIIFDYV